MAAADATEQQRLSSHSLTLQLSSIVVVGASFLQSVVMTRYLGAHDFGLIALVVAFVTIVNQIADFRAWELISNQGAVWLALERRDHVVALFVAASLICLASGAAAAFTSIVVGTYLSSTVWREPALTIFVCGYGLTASWGGLTQNLFALMRITESYILLASLRGATAVLSLVFVALAAWGNWGLTGMFIAYSCGAALGPLAAILAGPWLLRRHVTLGPVRCRLGLLRSEMRDLRTYLMRSWVSGSLQVVATQADEFILGIFSVPTVVGVYRVTKNFGRLALTFADSVPDVMFPQAARLWASDDRESIFRLVRFILQFGSAVVALILVVSIWALPQIIGVIYGAQFRPTTLLVALIMLNALYIPFLWCGPVFRVTGRLAVALRIELITAALSFSILLVLTPLYGEYGAAIGFSAHSVIYSAIAGLHFWKHREIYFGAPVPA